MTLIRKIKIKYEHINIVTSFDRYTLYIFEMFEELHFFTTTIRHIDIILHH
jgi:hypothetical protein